MDLLHAILFAILQGATELFPVSSLGHAVIVPKILHWHINQASDAFLPFLVMLHLGTAIGLLVYFWRDWWAMLEGLLGRGYAVETSQQRGILLRLIVATLPAIVIGAIVKKPVAHLFASPLSACIFLILNGGLLWLGERLRAQGSRSFGKTAATLSYMDALVIGLFQCLAFLPGISRSGAAIVGGLRRGVAHEPAAKFTFLMGTPVIFAASVLEIPKLLHQHELHALFGTSLIAAVVAGIVAWASTAFLMRYFRDHDSWALLPFAWYCALGGALAFVAIIVGL
jgi:undecaprenyl-diphosphatase